MVGDKLALNILRDGVSHLELTRLDGTEPREIDLPVKGRLELRKDERKGVLTVSLESLAEAPRYFQLSADGGMLGPISGAGGGLSRSDRYEVRREFYRSKDGISIPLTLIARAGDFERGTRPVLLEGYGGFGVPIEARFRSDLIPWLDRGGVLALPALRGGSDLGQIWYASATRHNKQRTIDDLIAAAEHLVERGLTRPELLGVSGGSHGGLVVGAAITQRPELFRAALIDHPILDLARHPQLSSHGGRTDEYGRPDRVNELEAMLSYSPYHNVREGVVYPAVLFTTGDSDDRVLPAHAWKMAARLERERSKGPILVRTLPETGHFGPVSPALHSRHAAEWLAFLAREVGLPAEPLPPRRSFTENRESDRRT